MKSQIISGCKYAVITSCSYLWLGVENIIRQQGGLPVRMTAASVLRYESMSINGDKQRPIQLCVFLTGDLCNRLETLKLLILNLNFLPAGCYVTIFSHLPPAWLYVTLSALVQDTEVLKKIRYCHQRPTPESLLNKPFPLLEEVICAEELAGIPSGAGLSTPELDAVLNYYQGKTVNVLSRSSGVAEKTIYAHRKSGIKKLSAMQQWLNDKVLLRKTRRSGEGGLLAQRAQLL